MIPSWYEEIFQKYSDLLNQYDNLYIGLSAGIDSNILLHWLSIYQDFLPSITAIHVNHQWHGEDSFIWADFARKSAEKYGFNFLNFDVLIDIDQKGAEACGREARYVKFSETMKENGLLLVAHHRSDQAETVMYRLIRGSGVMGLGGMRALTELKFGCHTLQVLRPLLDISKTALYEAGKAQNIPWMEDYTNHGTEEARNQIRNGIFPKIAEYFPYYEQTFARSAQLLQEGDELLNEIAEEDYEQNVFEERLNLKSVRLLSVLRQKNLLRYWLKYHSVTLEKRQFDELYISFLAKKPITSSCFNQDDWEMRVHQDHLCFLHKQKRYSHRYELVEAPDAPPLSFWQDQALTLITREQGVSFDPIWRNKSQTVKKLLQEIDLAPWLRSDIQMLKNNNNALVWIEHLGLSRSYQSECQALGYLPIVIRE